MNYPFNAFYHIEIPFHEFQSKCTTCKNSPPISPGPTNNTLPEVITLIPWWDSWHFTRITHAWCQSGLEQYGNRIPDPVQDTFWLRMCTESHANTLTPCQRILLVNPQIHTKPTLTLSVAIWSMLGVHSALPLIPRLNFSVASSVFLSPVTLWSNTRVAEAFVYGIYRCKQRKAFRHKAHRGHAWGHLRP